MSKEKYEYNWISLLSCGCLVNFEPMPSNGDRVLCRAHGKATVLDRQIKEYLGHCSYCGWIKRFGVARLGAEIGAAKHRQRVRRHKPSHVVKLYGPNGKLHRTFGSESDGQLSVIDL